MQVPAQNAAPVRYEIAPRSIALILATLFGVWMVYQLRLIVLVLIVALVFAGTLNPLVEWLERHRFRRVPALALLFVGLLLVVALLIFLVVPPLIDQLGQIVTDAPHRREQLIALLRQHDATTHLAEAVRNLRLQEAIAQVESFLVGFSPQALQGVGYAMTTVVLAFYLLADGKRSQGVLYALVPRVYHMRLARILHGLETIVGGYMRGQLITSLSVGLFTFLLLVACRVPNALFLSIFAALVDVIPFVGALLASGPAVLSALAISVPKGILVLVVLILYQEFENRILIPKVYGRTLRLTPATVVLALLSGAMLGGIIGALLALPIAAALQMMLLEMRVDMPGDDSDDRSELARDARAEATYESLSAGATAPEAGQIARNLAQEIRDAGLAGAEKPAETVAP